nr:unnamed protein product [Digitaria exilis]
MLMSNVLAAAEAARVRHRQHRQPCKSVTFPLSSFRQLHLPWRRDWAGLPLQTICSIFHKSDPVQIMLGADKVCRSWRRAARDVPELWRRIDMRGYEELSHRNLADLNQMAVDAVVRSQGQCQAFIGDRDSVTDGVLRFLAHRAPSLKSLILISCGDKVSAQGFSEAIQMFPQLEELELTECLYLHHEGLFDVVSKACPRLKHMRHSHTSYIYCACCPLRAGDDREAMGIATMHEIRSLRLVHNNLTNQGLTAILDNCRHLESLEIRNCCNIVIDDALRAKCAHIKSLKLVWYIGDEYCEDDYEPSPISECFTCLDYFKNCTTEQYRNGRQTTTDNNGEKHMVVAIVHKIRALEFYRNDITRSGRYP